MEKEELGEIRSTLLSGNMTPEEVTAYYDKWSENGRYDKVSTSDVYKGPEVTASMVASLFDLDKRQNVKILDVGSGTGLVADHLRGYNFQEIDALEPSPMMINTAKQKNLYKSYINDYLHKESMEDANGTYDCVVTVSCMIPGHIPAEGLVDLLRLCKKGGYVVVTSATNYDPSYIGSVRSIMKKMEYDKKWHKISELHYPNHYYESPGVIYVFKVL